MGKETAKMLERTQALCRHIDIADNNLHKVKAAIEKAPEYDSVDRKLIEVNCKLSDIYREIELIGRRERREADRKARAGK